MSKAGQDHALSLRAQLLTTDYGIDRHLAMAYLSAAGDFAVSQVVDSVKGIHGKIRKSDFDGVTGPN